MQPSSRGNNALIPSIVFVVLAWVVVAMRVWTRFGLLRNVGLDEYLIVLSLFCSTALVVLIGEQVRYGMGRHIATLSDEEQVNSMKCFWASLLVYYLSLGLTKSSILLQYLRLFPLPHFRRWDFGVLAVVVLYTTWAFFASIFECWPISYFWTKAGHGVCLNQAAVWFTNASINIATDIAIILLPMPVLKGLNLGSRQRRAVMGVFALGGFVCVTSILRLQSLVKISNSTDATYDNPSAAMWSSIETSVGIICACLPTLRPLLSRWFPRLMPWSSARLTENPDFSGYGARSRVATNAEGGVNLSRVGRSKRGADTAAGGTGTGTVRRGWLETVTGRRGSEEDEEADIGWGALGKEGGEEIRVVTVLEQRVEVEGWESGEGSEKGAPAKMVPRSPGLSGASVGDDGLEADDVTPAAGRVRKHGSTDTLVRDVGRMG